jgi:hypothetical protein
LKNNLSLLLHYAHYVHIFVVLTFYHYMGEDHSTKEQVKENGWRTGESPEIFSLNHVQMMLLAATTLFFIFKPLCYANNIKFEFDPCAPGYKECASSKDQFPTPGT